MLRSMPPVRTASYSWLISPSTDAAVAASPDAQAASVT
jgi:hypothetical protein